MTKFYSTGKPCKRGHVALRYIKSKTCIECVRQRRRDNPDYFNRHHREAYRRDRAAHLARGKRHRAILREHRPWERLILAARTRSTKKGIPMTIDHDWGRRTWTGKCSLTGFPFDLTHNRPHGHPLSPSIDRISVADGYTPENSRFVLNCVNAFKQDMSEECFLAIARALVIRTSTEQAES